MGDKKRQDPKGKFHKIGLRIFAAFASRFFGIVQNDSIPPIRRAYGAFLMLVNAVRAGRQTGKMKGDADRHD